MTTARTSDSEAAFVEFLAQFVTEQRRALFDRVLEQRTRHVTVVLEDIYHSHNTSACLRTCDCFGVQDVHIIEGENRHEINTDVALGSTQWLTLQHYDAAEDNTLACIHRLKNAGYRIVATSPHAESHMLDDFLPTQPVALMFGSEQNGLSETAMEAADDLLRIPMFGFTESFNISVTVALCLQQLTKTLRDSDINWQLTPDERETLRRQWIKQTIGYRLPQFEARFQREQGERPV